MPEYQWKRGVVVSMPVSGARRKVRPSVLVAEGSRNVRELFLEYLIRAGFDAIGTDVGEEAVAALATGATSAVVLDLELAAFDTAHRARTPASARTGLVLTGRRVEHLPQSALHAELVLKPCLPSTLVAAVMRGIVQSGRRAAAR